jgi:hypothetical protein
MAGMAAFPSGVKNLSNSEDRTAAMAAEADRKSVV